MNLSKNMSYRSITATALAMGLSISVYAAPDQMKMSEPMATMPMTQTTKAVTTTTTHAVMKHKMHHNKSKKTEVQRDSAHSEKPVIWKNGVIFNDVEPTAQSQSSPFGIPASTDDTLKGGITSTISPAPMN